MNISTVLAYLNRTILSESRRIAFGMAITLIVGMAPAHASHAPTAKPAPNEPVRIFLERKKVTLVEGKEAMVSAESAQPGEVIEETATYQNRSKRTFTVDATLPVPAYTELVLGATRPSNVTASTDGTTFARPPLRRKVQQSNGVVIEQTIPVGEYRFLRWSGVELGPEKSFVVSARFKLSDGAPSTTNLSITATATQRGNP